MNARSKLVTKLFLGLFFTLAIFLFFNFTRNNEQAEIKQTTCIKKCKSFGRGLNYVDKDGFCLCKPKREFCNEHSPSINDCFIKVVK
jgi:hypothetical protein